MFERLKRLLRPAAAPADENHALLSWALDRLLGHQRLSNGGIAVQGMLLERPFQAGCAPSSRPYIEGFELMARADLGLRDDVNIIVMHRALKRVLEKAAGDVYAHAVTHVRTTEKPLPEELLWLSLYRDAGWPGPTPAFWARYCVLTDDLEAARQWLDADAVNRLWEAPAAFSPAAPFFMALTRGKVYLRLQMDAPHDEVIGHHALDMGERFSARALACFGAESGGSIVGVSSPA